MKSHRVCLIGAGNIAELHIAVLRELKADVIAVSDCDEARARDFAARWGVPRAVGDVHGLLDEAGIDVAHVLVPPPAHRAVAEPLLRAGVNVFVEKPMAASAEECLALTDAARVGGAALAVNHNAVHQPAHQAIKATVAAGTIGRLRHMTMRFSMPLHQLKARQFGHWMFDAPRNLLLEQAVHPLSQIEDLLGPTAEIVANPGPPLRIAKGLELHPTWLINCICARGTAQLLFSVCETYPSWGATVLGRDGAIHVDYVAGRVWREEAHKWLEPLSLYRAGMFAAKQLRRESRRNLAAYIASTLRLVPRTDGHFVSMRRSIGAFYRSLDDERACAMLNGMEGRRIVMLCETIAAGIPAPARQSAQAATPSFAGTGSASRQAQAASFADGAEFAVAEGQGAVLEAVAANGGSSSSRWTSAPGTGSGATARSHALPDVLVVGGTGFIGSQLVPMLVGKGMRVAVLSRNPRNLPESFWNRAVSIHRGSITQREHIAQALHGAKFAVNLAHAGGAVDWPSIERAIVGGSVVLAKLCLEEGVRRLVHVSSISALYLGDRNAIITGATPPDPRAERREPYSRAKAVAEAELMRLHTRDGLPVCILRPGLVVGEGGLPFHDGIGFYNTDRHCLGWNRGDNSLPFVLVEDVANAAMCALAASNVDGRCYNIVGDVRLTAREYIGELARALDRPLRYSPQSLAKLYGIELAKWTVKRAVGRTDALPSYADLRSRGIVCRFDCSDAERDLDWRPVSDRAAFVRRGIDVHAGS